MAQSTAMEIAAYHMVFYSTRRRTLVSYHFNYLENANWEISSGGPQRHSAFRQTSEEGMSKPKPLETKLIILFSIQVSFDAELLMMPRDKDVQVVWIEKWRYIPVFILICKFIYRGYKLAWDATCSYECKTHKMVDFNEEIRTSYASRLKGHKPWKLHAWWCRGMWQEQIISAVPTHYTRAASIWRPTMRVHE